MGRKENLLQFETFETMNLTNHFVFVLLFVYQRSSGMEFEKSNNETAELGANTADIDIHNLFSDLAEGVVLNQSENDGLSVFKEIQSESSTGSEVDTTETFAWFAWQEQINSLKKENERLQLQVMENDNIRKHLNANLEQLRFMKKERKQLILSARKKNQKGVGRKRKIKGTLRRKRKRDGNCKIEAHTNCAGFPETFRGFPNNTYCAQAAQGNV